MLYLANVRPTEGGMPFVATGVGYPSPYEAGVAACNYVHRHLDWDDSDGYHMTGWVVEPGVGFVRGVTPEEYADMERGGDDLTNALIRHAEEKA